MPTVLITTAIAPPQSVPYLAMTQVAARTAATRGAIYFWAAQKVRKLVIADATGVLPLREDEVALLAETGCTVEQVCYRQDEASPVRRGKGHAEGQLIAFALENAQLLKQAKHFYKSTGKTFCRNFWQIDTWLTRQQASAALWVAVNRSIEYGSADLRFFYASPAFFREAMQAGYAATDDTRRLYAETTVMASAAPHMTRGFAPRPLITGFSGTHDAPYPEMHLGDMEHHFPCLLRKA